MGPGSEREDRNHAGKDDAVQGWGRIRDSMEKGAIGIVRIVVGEHSRGWIGGSLMFVALLYTLVTFVRYAFLSHVESREVDSFVAWTTAEGPKEFLQQIESNSAFHDKLAGLVRSATESAPPPSIESGQSGLLPALDDELIVPGKARQAYQETHRSYRGLTGHDVRVGFLALSASTQARKKYSKATPSTTSTTSTTFIPSTTFARFSAFAREVVTLYRAEEQRLGQEDRVGEDYEAILTRAFGLPSSLADKVTIPWTYIASSEGFQATFPASRIHARPAFDNTERPWWWDAIDRLETTGGRSGLSKPYADYASQVVGNQIRTYSVVLEVDETTRYVVSVDFKWATPERGLTGLVSPGRLVAAMGWQKRPTVTFFSMAFVVVGIISWSILSRKRETFVILSRKGLITAKNLSDYCFRVETQTRDERAQGLVIGAKASYGVGVGSLTYRIEHSDSKVVGLEGEERLRLEDLAALRGLASYHWKLMAKTRLQLPAITISVYKTRSTGSVFVKYRRQSNVELAWTEGDALSPRWRRWVAESVRGLPSDSVASSAELLDENAIGARGRLSEVLTEKVPDELVQTVQRYKDLGHGVFRYCNGILTLSEIYYRSDIKGVLRGLYLERLIALNRLEVLEVGGEVNRVVVFDDAKSFREFLAVNREPFSRIAEEHQRFGSLKVMLLEDLATKDFVPSKKDLDFAIIDESSVAVTENYYLEDAVRGRENPPTQSGWEVRIHGFLSTLETDVEYYRYVYKILDADARPLDEISDRVSEEAEA